MAYRDSHHKALTDYPRPSVAVDTAVLTVSLEGELSVVLVRAGAGKSDGAEIVPAAGGGHWRLPGTFLHEGERLADAVARSLEQKAGIRGIAPHQLRVFDDPTRDDRGWVLSVAHVAAVPSDAVTALSDDAAVVPVNTASELELGYDHAEIIADAVRFMRQQYERGPDPFGLLAEPFTLRELQRLHEAVAGAPVVRDTFRRKMIDQLKPTGELTTGTVGKPARSFRHGLPGALRLASSAP